MHGYKLPLNLENPLEVDRDDLVGKVYIRRNFQEDAVGNENGKITHRFNDIGLYSSIAITIRIYKGIQ